MSSAIAGTREAVHSPFSVLLTTSLVSSLIMLDSNIVAITLPTIGRSLSASFTDIQWVISAYILTYAALLLAAGNYADLHGRKKAMLIGLSIFALASAICGLATSVLMLNLARAAQGIGGALLLTASLAIISHDFTGVERTRAFAFWGASLGIALAAGPILGGTITNFFGWRWVFFINLPACAGLVIATLKIIAESRDPDAKQLDLPGILTFSSGLGLTIWTLIDGNDVGWTSAGILLRLVIAAVLFIVFVRLELRHARPMVDFTLFGRSTFLGAVLAMISYGASAQVMVFFLPLFLQNAYGFEPLIAGLAMIPFALPMVLAPRVTRQLSSRFSGRVLLTAGLAITGIGNLLFWITARSGLPYPIFAVSMLVAGGGAGLLNGTTVKVLGGAVPSDRAGMASGLASTTRFYDLRRRLVYRLGRRRVTSYFASKSSSMLSSVLASVARTQKPRPAVSMCRARLRARKRRSASYLWCVSYGMIESDNLKTLLIRSPASDGPMIGALTVRRTSESQSSS